MQPETAHKLSIRVAGVGGAGVKIAAALCAAGCEGADIAAVDTDETSLRDCPAENAVCVGRPATGGMGSGGDPAIAKEAAISDLAALKRIASGADVFICAAGLGGGTGSVIAPILAKLAAENGAKLAISFSLMPLSVEGVDKSALAERSARYMRKVCDAAAALPNDIILARSALPVKAAFEAANMYAVSAIGEICAMLLNRGVVNIGIPSFKKAFFQKGLPTFFGIGCGKGANAVGEAAAELASSPLLVGGAAGLNAESLMISLVCGEDFEMNKMQSLLETVSQTFGVRERICFGASVDKSMQGRIKVCAMGLANPAGAGTPQTAPGAAAKAVAQNWSAGESDGPRPFPTPAAPEGGADFRDGERREEPKPKKRIGFFGFGRSKAKPAAPETKSRQSEFAFVEMSEQRGFFEDTPVNMRKGEDLDVPTFMRRNIKINL